MNLNQVVPEYSVEESAKTLLTEKQLECIGQTLLDLELSSVLLRKEVTDLASGLSTIEGNCRGLRLWLQDMV